MEGHFYSDEEAARILRSGMRLADVFVYKCKVSGTGRLPCLKLTSEAMSWYWLYDSESSEALQQEGACVNLGDQVPFFHLGFSNNLAGKEDLILQLARSRSLPVSPPDEHIGRLPAVGYSTLGVWGLQKDELTCGILFLDFLFDLGHTEAFASCPGIGQISQSLLSHPLVNAIRDRAEFYWRRQCYHEASQLGSMEKREPDFDAPDVIVNDAAMWLVRAREGWLRTCMKKGAEDVLLSGMGWFHPIEDEVRRIVFDSGRSDWGNVGGDVWYQTGTHQEGLHRQADEGEKRTGREYPGRDDQVGEQAMLRSARVVIWFLARYDLDAAAAAQMLRFGSFFRSKWLVRLFAVFVLLPLLILGCASPSITGALGLSLLLPLLLLPTRLTQMVSFIWNASPAKIRRCAGATTGGSRGQDIPSTDSSHTEIGPLEINRLWGNGQVPVRFDLPYHPFKRALWAVILAMVWCFSTAGAGAFEEGPTDLCGWVVVVIMGLPVAGFAVISCAVGWRAWRDSRRERSTPHLPFMLLRLALPRMAFAVIFGWLTTYWGNFWGVCVHFSVYRAIAVGGLLLLVSFVFTAAKTHRITHDAARSLGRALLVLSLAMVMSLYFGLVTMSAIGEAVIAKELAPSPEPVAGALPGVGDQGKHSEGLEFPRDRPVGRKDTPPKPLDELEGTLFWGRLRAAYIWRGHSDGENGADSIRTNSSEGYGLAAASSSNWGGVAVFPGMLLLLSCLAVFFGMFLQLIFDDDREMTEPL